MNNLYGTNVIVVPEEYVTWPAQYRFPRSKKKRIQKKWRKNKQNYRPTTHAVMMNGKIAITQRIADALKRKAAPTTTDKQTEV